MTCIDVTSPPLKANQPLLVVVAAVIIDDKNRLLISQRPAGKAMPGLWEFPGGKLNSGELPEQALVRELREELGIETSAGCLWPLTFASYAYSDFHLLMPLFGCRIWTGQPEGCEGQVLRWVTKEELKDYEMPPADDRILPLLFELL